jgi:hypothetical protein
MRYTAKTKAWPPNRLENVDAYNANTKQRMNPTSQHPYINVFSGCEIELLKKSVAVLKILAKTISFTKILKIV